MFAVFINLLIILITMFFLLRFMYPKPKDKFFAQKGDDTSLRACAFCGQTLPVYRGVLLDGQVEQNIQKPLIKDKNGQVVFFCNFEHAAQYLKDNSLHTLKDVQNKQNIPKNLQDSAPFNTHTP